MAHKSVRFPERVSPKHRVVQVKADPNGKTFAVLDCGHDLTARNVWPGKMRWCPTCNPPRSAGR